MAVERMSFVNVAGDINEIDHFTITTVIPNEIQLVRALSVLDSVTELRLFTDDSPYKSSLNIVEQLIEEMGIDISKQIDLKDEMIDIDEIRDKLDDLQKKFTDFITARQTLMASREHKEQIMKQILPIKELDVEVDDLFHFEFMKFRFGRIPKDSFDKILKYIEKLDAIIFKVFEEGEDVFCMYFMPEMIQNEVDSLFASLYFERIRLSDEIAGYPKQALHTIDNEILVIDSRLQIIDEKVEAFKNKYGEEIRTLYFKLLKLEEVFEIRRYAARSESAFYLTGWIPKSNVKVFKKLVDDNERVSVIIEDDEDIREIKPPTKLNNPPVFKPFEALVGMYGIPSYNEIDPTVFVAITYMLLFGLMFGDVGQGFVIAAVGFYLFKYKKVEMAKIAVYLGVTSMITGLFYGSVFGNEEIVGELFPFIPVFNPMHNINVILVAAIVLGVLLIVTAMGLNMLNALRNNDYGKLLFDRNGVIGLVLYIAILTVILTNINLIKVSLVPITLLIIGSLVVIMFSHPLQNWLNKKDHIFPEDKGGFFVEAIFEVIETILAILSNSISFIRVGAFALNHVGFFLAFHMLADMVGGTGSVGVMIFGNILIIALEGLIVFIQGLRLEYYELFSRFFEGSGKEFKPFTISNKMMD